MNTLSLKDPKLTPEHWRIYDYIKYNATYKRKLSVERLCEIFDLTDGQVRKRIAQLRKSPTIQKPICSSTAVGDNGYWLGENRVQVAISRLGRLQACANEIELIKFEMEKADRDGQQRIPFGQERKQWEAYNQTVAQIESSMADFKKPIIEEPVGLEL